MLRQWLSFRTLSIALAMVLLVTAVLKLHLLLTDPFADIKTGTSLPLLWLAVFAEAGVVWIVFSKAPEQLKWLSLVFLFGIMSAVSIYRVLQGNASCGCTGHIEITPAWIFAFDVSMVALLLIYRHNPPFDVMSRLINLSSQTLGAFVGLGVVGMIFLAFESRLGNEFFRTRFLGQDIVAPPVWLGNLKGGEPVVCDLKLVNRSSNQRTIVGIGKSCDCITPQEIVHTRIPKNGELSLKITINSESESVGDFHQRVLFYLDSPRQYVVAADLFGKFEGK